MPRRRERSLSYCLRVNWMQERERERTILSETCVCGPNSPSDMPIRATHKMCIVVYTRAPCGPRQRQHTHTHTDKRQTHINTRGGYKRPQEQTAGGVSATTTTTQLALLSCARDVLSSARAFIATAISRAHTLAGPLSVCVCYTLAFAYIFDINNVRSSTI